MKCTAPTMMENEANRASGASSGMQHITRAGCLGTGHSAENEGRFPVVVGGVSGAIPPMANTRPCRGSTQQQENQPVETVSQAALGRTKIARARQSIQWSEEKNTIIMHQYYIITKLETIKIGYRRELHDRVSGRYPDLEISEQGIADQPRAIVTTGLL